MIEKCKLLQKIYILQSNIIESSVNSRPFISEVSTIAYAVNECFDGILLKDFISQWRYPCSCSPLNALNISIPTLRLTMSWYFFFYYSIYILFIVFKV